MLKFYEWARPLASALALAFIASAAPAQTDGAKYQPVIDSTVRVLALMPDGHAKYGTGWVVESADKENRAGAAVIITAMHVVAGAQKVTVVEPGSAISDQRAATVAATTAERDLAFLEVKDINEPALTLTRTLPGPGDVIHAMGFSSASDANETSGRAVRASPKLGGFSKTFRGPVSPQAQAPIDQIEYDAPILAGFSGGPVVNECARVIGLTIKDGGHLRLGDAAEVNVAQGVSLAVQSDEIIEAAHDAGVTLKIEDGACGTSRELARPPPPPCSKPFISVENGHACLPLTPTAMQSMLHRVSGVTGLIIVIAAIALLVVIGAAIYLLRERREDNAPEAALENARGSVIGGSTPLAAGTRPLGIAGFERANSRSIRLTGRGSSGETIDLRFAASELMGAGVMLGVEGDDGAVIPDTRAEKHVSRRHASLSYDGKDFLIRDNKSTNKTRIGDKTLDHSQAHRLMSGDRLTLGDVVLNVTID